MVLNYCFPGFPVSAFVITETIRSEDSRRFQMHFGDHPLQEIAISTQTQTSTPLKFKVTNHDNQGLTLIGSLGSIYSQF